MATVKIPILDANNVVREVAFENTPEGLKAVHQISGSVAVPEGAKEVTLEAVKAELEAVKARLSETLSTQLSGSNQDLRGKAADKPAADSVPAGTTYWAIDRIDQPDEVTVSDGAAWTNA